MDDLQKTVVEFIKQYMPDAISDARKFKAYLCDCMPDERAKRKVMFDAYSEGIHEIIRNATDSKMTMHKCFKILVDDCGFDEKPVAWTVETWACIYGHSDWRVAYEDYPAVDDKVLESEVYISSETVESMKKLEEEKKSVKKTQGNIVKNPGISPTVNRINNILKNKPPLPKYYGGTSHFSTEDDEEEGEKENNLLIDDILDLEDAGLDVDELTEMDWSERYDAIEEAGLDPFDYDYGFDD